MAKVAISCVVDDAPHFLMQAWNWLTSLRALGTQRGADLLVHHVAGIPASALRPLADLGAELVPVEPFGNGPAAYGNKLRQIEADRLRGFETVVLSDADLVFRTSPLGLAGKRAFQGKLVDANNPPEAVWRALFEEAGFEGSIPLRKLDLRPGVETFATNFNGGLYVIPGEMVPELHRRWEKWTRFCLERGDLLRAWHIHSDQIGMGMALLEIGADCEHLQPAANFPTHAPKRLLERLSPTRIDAFHYHRAMDNHGLLRGVGIGWIDEQIGAVNKLLRDGRRSRFDNRLFWDFRYDQAPGLGSGLGSRGETLLRKRALLTPYCRALAGSSVLDVGCGDLETMRHMPLARYHGTDVSEAALRIAREKRPDWTFGPAALDEIADGAFDVALCLDVLIHQPTAADFDALVAALVRISRTAIIVSGYASDADHGGITFFTRPLGPAFLEHDGVAEVVEIGRYRDVTVLLVIKKPAAPANGHDIGLPGVAYGCSETPDWRLLLALLDESRARLGFFPRTIIRTIEYPWFAQRLARHRGGRVLDLGAGVCVLPLWLSGQGCRMVTIDSHPLVRDPAQRGGWNEWGFLDYGLLDAQITSFNEDAAEHAPDEPYEAVYSVSVLEHLPADLRRRIFSRLPGWLAPGGRLYLSFDLVPDTDRLWNRSEGRKVEAEAIHGTLPEVLRELEDAGLRLVEACVRRRIAGSRTDLALLEAATPI